MKGLEGERQEGTDPFTMKQFARCLNELMIVLQISKAIILGFSGLLGKSFC